MFFKCDYYLHFPYMFYYLLVPVLVQTTKGLYSGHSGHHVTTVEVKHLIILYFGIHVVSTATGVYKGHFTTREG